MAGNVVNLNRFRKKKAKEAKEKQAEINRIRHGRTGAEKERELAERRRATRALDGKRIEGVPDEQPVANAGEPAPGSPEPNEPEPESY
ncbi:DUF4169 family protein [bacterium]|nr:MAG: DUF4169 family protein [bacterium]